MNKTYAGIGSRRISSEERLLCVRIGRWLAERGWHLYTGAAKGADQAFAEGALEANGKVTLCLPWPSYEWKWVQSTAANAAIKLLLPHHEDAHQSVDNYHPRPDKLTKHTRLLHARNYLIIDERKFVIALPAVDSWGGLGGTGQGIRIAEGEGVPVLRLDQPNDRLRIVSKVYT